MMRSNKLNDADIKREAIAAKDYARKHIVDIYNLVENNDLPAAALRDLEARYKESRRQITTIANQIANQTLPRLQTDNILCEHDIMLSVTRKTKIGNCEELARYALEYFVTKSDFSIRAEIFKLGRGDHVFVVVGRKKGSNPSLPSTWGKKAYICDPWDNTVFPATEYAEKLKNFSPVILRNGGIVFKKENYDVYKHHFVRKKGLNTDYFKQKRRVDLLEQNFLTHVAKRRDILETYLLRLKKSFERLSGTYSEENIKVDVLRRKMTEINLNIAKLDTLRDKVKTHSYDLNNNKRNYLISKNNLETMLVKVDEAYKNSLALMNERQFLFSYNNKKSLRTRLRMFFKLPSESQKEIEKAVKEAQAQYLTIPKSLVSI